jgi:hypothetical protein
MTAAEADYPMLPLNQSCAISYCGRVRSNSAMAAER